jgi:hypothetical protein
VTATLPAPIDTTGSPTPAAMSMPLLLVPLKPVITWPCAGQPQSLRREAGGMTVSGSLSFARGLGRSAPALRAGGASEAVPCGVAAAMVAPGGAIRSTCPASRRSGSCRLLQRAMSPGARPAFEAMR